MHACFGSGCAVDFSVKLCFQEEKDINKDSDD